MRTRWVGVAFVVIVAVGIVTYKEHRFRSSTSPVAQSKSSDKPEIVFVVDPREADTADNCTEIIRLVRAAAKRGVTVQELSPNSKSPLRKQYKVLTIPTVLILDSDGNLVSRYEGEENATVQQIRDGLVNLAKVKH
jgi:thioredoxin-like negative regulator of GroEL